MKNCLCFFIQTSRIILYLSFIRVFSLFLEFTLLYFCLNNCRLTRNYFFLKNDHILNKQVNSSRLEQSYDSDISSATNQPFFFTEMNHLEFPLFIIWKLSLKCSEQDYWKFEVTPEVQKEEYFDCFEEWKNWFWKCRRLQWSEPNDDKTPGHFSWILNVLISRHFSNP